MTHTKPRTVRHALALLSMLVAAALLSPSPAHADAGKTSLPAQPVVLALKPYADTPLRTVEVKVGTRTLPFLFDTGGGLTVATPETTKALGCQPFGQVTGFRADGEKMTLKRCGPVTLQIDGYTTTGEVAVFDLMVLIRRQVEQARKAGHDVAMPPTLGGLVGLASLRHQTVTLDYAHDRVIVETPRSAHARTRSMQPVNVRVATEASGSVVAFLQARAPTGTLWLEVDSGNNGPTALAPHAIKQLGITLPKGKKMPLDIDVMGLGQVPATVTRRPMIYDGQLGIALIRKLVLTIDLDDGRAWAAFSKQDAKP